MKRRHFLALTGTGIGLLAGCSGSQNETNPADTPTPTDTNGNAETTAETDTGTTSLDDGSVAVGDVNGWPMFSADARNTGVAENVPQTEGEERWTVELAVGSPPVVADGTVYVGKFDYEAAPEDNGLYALNPEDGSEQWVYPTEQPIHYTPAVGDDLVYAKAEQEVVGVDVADGSERWRYELEDRYLGAPTIANGAVYVSAGGRILELDAVEGTELQTITLPGGYPPDVVGAPAVTDNDIYASAGSQVKALSLDDGSQRWQAEDLGDGNKLDAPTVVGDTVFTASVNRTLPLCCTDALYLVRLFYQLPNISSRAC